MALTNETKACSLVEIIELTKSIIKTRDNASFWFRGQSKAEWDLLPAAARHLPWLESQRYLAFRYRAPSFTNLQLKHDDYAAWLILMQHHGTPTRLLDWSESLLAAVYFAVDHTRHSDDAAIFLLDVGKLNQAENGRSSLPLLNGDLYREWIEGPFKNGRLSDVPHLPVAVIGDRYFQRSSMQKCCYTLHRSRVGISKIDSCNDFLHKITIPHDCRQSVLYDLSLCGIRKTTFFPDLDSLSCELLELGPDEES